MNLLKNLSFLILLFTTTFSHAQSNEIIVEPPSKTIAPQEMSKETCGTRLWTADEIRQTLEVIDPAGIEYAANRNAGTSAIGLAVWIVRNTDGSGGLTLDQLNIGLAGINYHYLDAGIEFYIYQINYIDNTTWYDFDSTEEGAMSAANQSPVGINIYFVNNISINGSGSYCGYARYPNNTASSNRFLMRNSCTSTNDNGTFAHELGHYFNLAHTHDNTEDGNMAANTEYVPRSGANSNCGIAGDLLCDTEADPNGGNDSNCNFVNNGMSTEDIFGNSYFPDIDNIMSYYSDFCGGIFTPQQYTRIMGGFATRLTHSAYDLDGASPATVADPSGLTATLNGVYGGNGIDLSWTDNSNNETGFLIEKSIDGGATFFPIANGGVGENVTTFTDTNPPSAFTTYHYRVKASNDDINHYSADAVLTTGLIYCVPSHSSGSCSPSGGALGIAIYNFSLSSGGTTLIDNPANGCNGPLTVFTPTFCPVVNAGDVLSFTANFQVGTPPSGPHYAQHVTVWVDANQNGDFTDAGEMLYQASAPAPTNTVTQNITIPVGALVGKTTLRIRTGSVNSGVVTSPCAYMAFSETEDYGLDIIAALPVELISFTGEKRADAVQLEWSTASEENNDYFVVERSMDGRNYEVIAEVSGKGTTVEINQYQAMDLKPQTGTNYYRLTQIDFDGTVHIQDKVVAVAFVANTLLSVHPNPLKTNRLTLDFTTKNSGEMQLEIIDMHGRGIQDKIISVERGENAIGLDLPDLAPGVYLLRTDQDGERQIVRFVKTR